MSLPQEHGRCFGVGDPAMDPLVQPPESLRSTRSGRWHFPVPARRRSRCTTACRRNTRTFWETMEPD
eukprot:9458152-Heterocapsa_arctica.AAC.1